MHQTKRITYIIPSLKLGGAELQVINQANELVRRNIPTQIISLSKKVPQKNLLSSDVELDIIPSSKMDKISTEFIFDHFKHYKLLIEKLNEFNPTHILACLRPAHFMARRVANQIHQQPKIWIYHRSTEFTQNPANTIPKKLFSLWNDWKGKQADFGHLYISKAVQKDIEKHISVQVGKVIHNALPAQTVSEKIVSEELTKFNLKENQYVVIPGRFHPVKGHELFLKACGDYIKKEDIQVVFAGYGPTEEKLKKIVEKKELNHLITITGQLKNQELLALVKASKFVIIPSLEEGLGNVSIEALMMGKTILSSNAGGLPEVVLDTKNGFVFEKGNGEDLYHKFVLLWNNFEVMKFEEEDQINDFNQRFTITSQIDDLLTIIQ